MHGIAHLKEPAACTEAERREFARLVREGFHGSDDGLPARIHAAKWLAFHYADDEGLDAIAGLKAPRARYCEDVFRQAAAPVHAAEYRLELGWVFVVPARRGNRIGEQLCRLLLARASPSPVFATSRPDNAPMTRILRALGFARVGQPYPRRREELALFVRARTR